MKPFFRIPPLPEDLEISHTKGSGPGGQNRNKRLSAVRVRHIPTGITVLATERRSQGQNLSAALERLEARLRALVFRPKPRVDSKPTHGSKQRRLSSKKVHSKTKKMRSSKADQDY